MDGSITIGTKLETKSFDAQIAKLEKDLETMVKTLETDSQVDIKVRMSKQEKIALQNDIEKTKNHIISLRQQKERLENEDNSFPKLRQGFEGLVSSAKRLVLGIIGVRGAFTLISRITSKYLQTNETLTQKLEANWVALGQILAPIIEMIIGLIRKAVTAVLYFISLLTNENYIRKANNAIMKQNAENMKKSTKNINANTKALKENLKTLASFDEMNVIQDNRNNDVGNVSGVSAEGFTPMPLFDLGELSPQTKEMIEKIAKAVKPIYDMIKKIIDWAKEHPDMIIAILGGVALLKLLKSIMGVANVSGLLGIHGMLLAIAAIGVISIVINITKIIDTINKVRELNKELREARNSHLESTKKQTEAIKEQIPIMEKNSKEVKETTDELLKNVKEQKNFAYVAKENYSNTNLLQKGIDKLSGGYQTAKNQIKDATEEEFLNLMVLKEMYEQGKLNDQQTQDYVTSLKDFQLRLYDSTENSKIFLEAWTGSKDDLNKMNEIFEETNHALVEVGQSGNAALDCMAEINGKKVEIKVEKSAIHKAADKARELFDELQKLSKKKTKVGMEVDIDGQVSETFSGSISRMFSTLTGKPIKLAQGGIVNNPGRGVPLASAIVGERGAEGVIPLTDSQQMSLLGEAIGRYITITANVTNTMNGRVISREIQKINAEQDFAYNR